MDEQGEEATQAEDPDSITLSEDDSVTRMAWSTEHPSSIKDKRINIDVVQDVEQQYLMEMVALQETQEESILVVEWKFDAEKDVEDTRGGLAGTVGPEIASRIKLLFGVDQQVSQETNIMVREGEKGVVVMDRVKEMNRTVLIKRRARKGQAREMGIRTPRIDDMFGAS